MSLFFGNKLANKNLPAVEVYFSYFLFPFSSIVSNLEIVVIKSKWYPTKFDGICQPFLKTWGGIDKQIANLQNQFNLIGLHFGGIQCANFFAEIERFLFT